MNSPLSKEVVLVTVDRLPGITDGEAEQLRSTGYTGVESLWEAVQRDGFKAVGARTRLTEARLAALLGTLEVRETRRTREAAGDHALELALQLTSLLLIAGLMAGVHYVLLGSVRRLWSANRVTTHAVVSAPDGLPAFSVVRENQVKSLTGPTTEQDLADPTSLTGRYTLVPLANGSAIRRDQVGKSLPDGALEGRAIVSLTVATSNLPEVNPPQPVTLLFSPLPGADPDAASAEIVKALLLNVRRLPDRVAVDVALMQSDLPTIARVAGQSLLVVSIQHSTGDPNGDRQDRQ